MKYSFIKKKLDSKYIINILYLIKITLRCKVERKTYFYLRDAKGMQGKAMITIFSALFIASLEEKNTFFFSNFFSKTYWENMWIIHGGIIGSL